MGDWSELPRPSYNCVFWFSQTKGKRGGEIAHQTPFAPCWHGSTSWSLGPKKLPNVNFKYLHMETTRAQGTLGPSLGPSPLPCPFRSHPERTCRIPAAPRHLPSPRCVFATARWPEPWLVCHTWAQLGVTSLDCPTVQGGMPSNGDNCLLLNWYPNYNSPGVDTIIVIQIDPNLWWFNTERRTKGQWKDA